MPSFQPFSFSLVATLAALALAGCAGHGPHSGMHPGAGPGTPQHAAFPAHGLVTLKSPHSPAETLARVEAQVKQRGLAVVARVDHAAGATRVGKQLRPTEVMIFGNPQAGTPLMECAQGVGIDLPMKALVWADAQGQTWLSYNDPVWMVFRHGGGACPAAENVRKALAAVAEGALKP